MTRPTWRQQAAVSAWLSFWFVFVYNGCNYLTSLRSDVGTCAFSWELGLFPFTPVLILAYWSIDLFFILAPFFCKTRFLLIQHLKRVSLGIAVAGIFFLFFPLQLAVQRPPVEGWLSPFFSSLENFHNVYNCAPSLHIILLTNLWSIYVTPARGGARKVLVVWFILIGASTLFCGQHHLIDVLTGQLVGLMCLWAFPSIPFRRPEVDAEARVNGSYRVAGLYLAGFLVLLALTVAGWPNSVFCLWAAASLFILALAYGGGGPTLFRKVQGAQLPGTRWLLNPYRWTANLTARYFNAGKPAYFELEPGLYLGRRLNDMEALELPISAVLDLTCEYDECFALSQKTYLNVPVLDLTLPGMEQLNTCLDFLERNPNAYVHCSLGRGRSCLVGMAYLISRGAGTEQAINRLRELRPDIQLAPGAREHLERFASLRNSLEIPPQ